MYLTVRTGGDELYRITERPYYIANDYNKGFGFVEIKIAGKKLHSSFYDINLNCQTIITKTGLELIDPKSCLPPAPGNNSLKIINHFTIIKLDI